MPFQLLSADAISTVTVGDQQVSRKGQKFSEIRFSGNQPCFQLCAEALYSPFKAGVYQGTGQETRVNLDLQITDDLFNVLSLFDHHFEKELKKLAPKANYHKLIQEPEGDYPARIRLKVNATGPMAARLWRPDQTMLGDIRSVNTMGTRVIAIVCFTKAWYMCSQAGVTAELRHGVVYEADAPDDVFPLA